MDPIERQAAIDDVCEMMRKCFSADDEELDAIKTTIGEISSAQPKRMKGRWMPEFNGRFTGGAYWFSCSRCKRIVPDVRNGGWNFCPNCGADMRETE